MSVDKFGRTLKTDSKGERGPRGEGFNLTRNGDYDIQKKRLRNVADPVDDSDAVNFKTLADRCITVENGEYNAKKRRLCNVKEPTDASDAVNLEYLKSKIPIRFDYEKEEDASKEMPQGYTKQAYSFHQYRVQDVAAPYFAGDAVNLQHFEDKVPIMAVDHWDFSKKRLSNIGDAHYEGEAVNLRTLKSITLTVVEGAFDAKNIQIANLADPRAEADAVTLRYLNNKYATLSRSVGTMITKNIADINSLRTTVNRHDGRLVQIVKDYDKTLKKFGTLLFRYLQLKLEGKTVSLPKADENNYLNWEEIFKVPDVRKPS